MNENELVYLTDAERAAWTRCEAATPGPWHNHEDAKLLMGFNRAGRGQPIAVDIAGKANRAFIAAARTDLPDALAEIARLRRVLTSSPTGVPTRKRKQTRPLCAGCGVGHARSGDAMCAGCAAMRHRDERRSEGA